MKEIIKRKIEFIQNDSKVIFDPKEHEQYNAGELKALSEIINDIENLSETLFVEKYQSIVQTMADNFESNLVEEASLDKLSGYNNAIVDVLSLLNPHYQYADSFDMN